MIGTMVLLPADRIRQLFLEPKPMYDASEAATLLEGAVGRWADHDLRSVRRLNTYAA